MRILIAGGGIAGLAASLALAARGREVSVFEQAPSFEEVGAGLQIGPNGARALKALGAWEAVAPFGYAPPAILIRDGQSGRILSRLPLDGLDYRVFHRADLLRGLLATASAQPGIRLETGRRVLGFAGRKLILDTGEESFDALIGADGIRSAIRQQLLGDGPAPFAGQVIYRALIPRAGVGDAGPEINLWLCPGGHVVHYPVSGGRNLNIVAAVNGAWTHPGWSEPADAGEVLACFSGMAAPLARLLGLPLAYSKWAGASRPAASHWGEGPVTLIGDAAHPMLPYLAQGAVMAIEDAATLGACLKSQEVETALRHYERLRQPRTARVAAASGRLARIYHAQGLERRARNLAIRLTPAFLARAQLRKLWDWRPS